MSRRRFIGGTAGVLAAAACGDAAAASITVTDMIGRKVILPKLPNRIVLLEARDVLSMGAIHPAPARLVVGWAATDRIDSDALREAYERQAGRQIALVGNQAPDSVSLEAVIALAPDLVVANAFADGGGESLVGKLEAAGVPMIFSSAADNAAIKGRLDDLPSLMRLWGAILGREAQAEAFLAFAAESRSKVSACIDGAQPVKTYLEVQSTYDDCCWAAGKAVWGELLEQAGGRSLDAVSAPWFQQVSNEQLIAEQPELYIASGGAFAPTMRPAIAPELPVADAVKGLEKLAARTGLSTLQAVKNKRVHGIWTGLITIPPLNPLFVEIVARWAHPERCAMLDPRATLQALNDRFFTVPIGEPCWASLSGSAP